MSLMSTEDFHDLVDDTLWKRLNLIRKIGNRAAHNGIKIYRGRGNSLFAEFVYFYGLCVILLF